MSDTTANSVIWEDGAASGIGPTGVSVAVPGDNVYVSFGAGAPSGAPTQGPLYVNTSDNKLYAYNYTSSAWVAVSGFNT